jgi:anti-sigma28 factor (negative regulator of flagellin synthesis)
MEELSLQVERGEYKVSAGDVARGIIDEHVIQ